jgi:hypothetical protein
MVIMDIMVITNVLLGAPIFNEITYFLLGVETWQLPLHSNIYIIMTEFNTLLNIIIIGNIHMVNPFSPLTIRVHIIQ